LFCRVTFFDQGFCHQKQLQQLIGSLQLLAGAAGVANSLGADFVKIKPPVSDSEKTSAELLKIITAAAGNTKVICSGGSMQDSKLFLQKLYDQIHIGGTMGNATGRNIFQHSHKQAVVMTQSIAAIVFDGKSPDQKM
jgi:DhnA family fructose-bisphosphate aldolase class Ia